MNYQTLHDTVDAVLHQMIDTDSHALLCLRVGLSDTSTFSSNAPPIQPSPIAERFASQLGSDDVFIELEQNHYFVLLKSVTESQMMLVTRLLRTAFNRGGHAGRARTLSIGCIIFSRCEHTGVELISVAENLAITAQGRKDSRILIKDLQYA